MQVLLSVMFKERWQVLFAYVIARFLRLLRSDLKSMFNYDRPMSAPPAPSKIAGAIDKSTDR